jgi:hypothetical protein
METLPRAESCVKVLRVRGLTVKNCQVVYYLWVDFGFLNAMEVHLGKRANSRSRSTNRQALGAHGSCGAARWL